MIRHLVFGSGASLVLSFLSLVLIARLFPLDFIADVKAVTVYGGWFAVVFTFQIHSSFLYFYNREGAPSEAVRSFSLGILIISALLCTAAFCAAFPLLYAPSTLNQWGLLLFSLVVGMNMLFSISPVVFSAQGYSRQLPVFMFVYSAGSLASLLLAYRLGFDANMYAASVAVASGAAIWSSKWRRFFGWASFNPRQLRASYHPPLGRYAARMSISIFLESLGDRVDKILSSRILSQAAFAKYSVLCFENPLVNLLLSSYGIAMVKAYPAGVAGKEAGFSLVWAGVVRRVSFVTFPISVFLIFNHAEFIRLVFGDRFTDAGRVFQIYLVTSLARYAPFQSLLRMEGALHYNVIMASAFFGSALLLGAVVLWFGWDMAFLASSYLAAWLAFNGLAILFFSRLTRMDWRRVVVPRVWLWRLIQCIVAALVGIAVDRGILLNLLSFSATYLTVVICFDAEMRRAGIRCAQQTGGILARHIQSVRSR